MSRTREINYKVSFTGDSKQALQAIQQLKTELASIGNMSVGKNSSQEMKQMVSSAQQLQTHLNRSFDANGNLNLAKFNNSLKTSNTSLAALSTNLLNGGKAGQKAFADLATAVSQAQRPVSSLHGVVGELWYTFKNTIKWGLASSAFNNLTSSLSKAIGYSKQLNTSLNNIRIVTGESAEAMEKFSIYANNTAKALKTTTTEVSDAALIYYQQGDTESVVKQKTEITTKAANVSPDSDAAQMSEYLTAVWNGYQAVAGEYEDYVDKLAAVGAATASSLEEVATGMTKVASTANTVGVDFDQLNAILSTVGSVTREAPETTGTAFKTIFARMEDLKMGETLEDGVTLGSVSKILDKVNISIFDTEGNLRDLGEVLEELMQNWNEWDRSTKVAVAEQLAGKRQYTQLFALLENQDMYYDALKTSQEAEGALQEMQDIYAESWVASNEKLKASIEDVYNDLINSDFAIGFVDTLSTIVNLIDEIVEGVGGAGAVFSGLGAILTKVFSTQIVNSMQQAAYTFSTITGSAQKQHSAVLNTVGEITSQSSKVDPTTDKKIQYSRQILEIEQLREKNAKSLTGEENRQLEITIQELKIRQQSIIEEQAKLDLLNDQTAVLEQQLENTPTGEITKKQYKSYLTLLGQQTGFEQIEQLFNNKSNQFGQEDFSNFYSRFTQANQTAGNFFDKDYFFVKELENIQKELQETGKWTDDLKRRFEELFKQRGLVKGHITQTFGHNAINQQIEDFEKEHPELKDVHKKYDNLHSNYQKIHQQQQEIDQANQNIEKDAKKIYNSIEQTTPAISQQVTNLTSGIFSLVSAVESFKNLGSIWSNEDLSIGEKLFQTVSALASGIMMATMAYNSLKEAKVGDLIITGRQRIAELKNLAINKIKNISLQESIVINKQKALAEAEDAYQTAKSALANAQAAGTAEEEAAAKLQAAWASREKAASELNETWGKSGNKLIVGETTKLLSNVKGLVARFWPALIAIIVATAVKWLAQLGQKAQEVLEEQRKKFQELKDELESLTKQIEDNDKEIEDYENRKGELTLDELEKLKALKQENNELKEQQKLKESLAEQESILIEEAIYHADQMNKISAPFLTVWDAIVEDFEILGDTIDIAVDGIESFGDALENLLGLDLEQLTTVFSYLEQVFKYISGSPLFAFHDLMQEVKTLRMTYDPKYADEVAAKEATKAQQDLIPLDADIKDLEERRDKYGSTRAADMLTEKYNERNKLRKTAAGEDYNTIYITPVLSKDGISSYEDELSELVRSGQKITEESLTIQFGSTFTSNLKEALEENNVTLEEWIEGLNGYYNDATSHLAEEFNKAFGDDAVLAEEGIQQALSRMTFEQAAYAQQIELSAKDIEFLKDNLNDVEIITKWLNDEVAEIEETTKNLTAEDQINLLQKALDEAVEKGQISAQLLKQIEESNIKIDLSGNGIKDIQVITDTLSQLQRKQILNDNLFAFASENQRKDLQKYTDEIERYKKQLENISDDSEKNKIQLNIDEAEEKLKTLTDKITSLPGYQEKVHLDFAIEDANLAIKELKALSQGIELIGEDYTVTYENLEKFREIYPELNTLQNEYNETGLKLTQEQIKYVKEAAQERIETETDEKEAEIDEEIKALEIKQKAIKDGLDLFQDVEEGKVNFAQLSTDQRKTLEEALTAASEVEDLTRAQSADESFSNIDGNFSKLNNSMGKGLGWLTGKFQSAVTSIANMFNSLFSGIKAGFQTISKSITDISLESFLENPFDTLKNLGSAILSGLTTTITTTKDTYQESQISGSYKGDSLDLSTVNQKAKSAQSVYQDLIDEAQQNEDKRNKLKKTLEDNYSKANTQLAELYQLKDQLEAIKNKAISGMNKAGEKSGGGGKDGKDKEEELVDILEDQIERYHEVNKQIEYQEQVLKRLQNARDKVYGQKYLDALNKEIDGQQEYIGLLQDRMVLYSAMLQSDREAAAALGATFDENGLITNYTSLTEAKLSDIQAQQKGMTDSEKKEQLDQEYEDFKAVLDQYEETFELLNDATTELDDAFTELNDLIADYVKTQIEAIETVQDKLDTINNIEERFYDNWDKMGERSALYNKQLQQTYDTADQWIAEIGQIEEMYKNGLLTQKAYAEAIGDAEEGLAASINTMFDLQEKMAKMVEETVNEVTARMDQYMAIYEDASKELQFYIDAFTKIYSRSSHAMAAELYNNQADVLQQQIKAEEMYMKTLQENQKQWEEYSDEWFQYEEGIREAKDKIISLTTDTLDALSNAYKEQIQAGIQAFNTAIGITDFDRLTDNFSKLQEESNRFLDYADRLYETTSLQQKINESINKQDSTAGKARLNNLLDELNALSDKAEVSQYEIDYLQKKYELTLKQNALDEANSQKTLRLMRNDQGDMVYSFVADTEKVTSAKQEYETAMNDLRELSEQYVSETSNNLLQYVKDYEDALLNLDETTFESRQEYEEAINEIVEYYSQLIYDTKEQLNIGEQNLAQDTYDQIVALRGDSTELTIALAQRESDAILGIKNEENDRILANYDEQSTRAREANEKMVNITQDMRDKLGNSYDEIRKKIEETAAEAVTAFETWHTEALKVATTTAKTLNPELKDTLTTLQSAEGASDKLSQALVDLVGNNLEGLTDLDDVFTKISTTLGEMFKAVNTNQKAFSEIFDNKAIQAYYGTLQDIINTDLQNNWGYQGGWAKDEMALMIEAVASGQYTEKGLDAYLTYHNSLRNQKIAAMTEDQQANYKQYKTLDELMNYIKTKIPKMSTGGYTAEGGLAFLHDKELVLNATDTENILAAAMILQGKGEAAAAAGINSGLSRAAASFTGSANNVDQSTNTFYVDFPNATSSSEIEIALTNLMNHADQYKFTS